MKTLTLLLVTLFVLTLGATSSVSAQRGAGESKCEKNDRQPDRSAQEKAPKEKAPKEEKAPNDFKDWKLRGPS